MVLEQFDFLAAAVRDRNVGALMPTTLPSVRQICSDIDRTRPVVVVEYGPGTGVFTRHLLKTLHPRSTVIAIELNKVFAKRLRTYARRRRVRQPRLVVVHDDAAKILEILRRCGHEQADYVLSGIPFSFLPPELRQRIVAATHRALSPTGSFIVYQYTFAMRNLLREQFAEVEAGITLLNFPPLRIMRARKIAAAKKPPRRAHFWRKKVAAARSVPHQR